MSTVAGVKPVPFLIGGEWVQDTSSYITHVNPATGEVNYEFVPAPKPTSTQPFNPLTKLPASPRGAICCRTTGRKS